MINHITIKNLAVVDALDLELNSGLTVLTGETGAGKSILIDALGLVLGDRADASAIRYGAERADIIAEFSIQNPQVNQWLIDNELDSDADCLIRRTVNSKGRSRGYINGHPIPLQQLKELGEKLVNIHGQNTHQTLLKTDEQRLLLDNFAGINNLRQELNQRYQHWKKTAHELQQLQQNTLERESRLDLLRFQAQELEEFNLQENELDELEDEHKKLSNASRLIETTQAQYYKLADDNGISSQLNQCQMELVNLASLDKSLEPLAELLNNALIQVDETSNELRHYLDALELDPQRLQWLDERIKAIYDLSRKHRIKAQELYALQETLNQELASLESADSDLESLRLEVEKALSAYFELAKKLTSQRKKAAKLLSEQVMLHIKELGMANCVFDVQMTAIESDTPQLHGMEVIEFHVSTNPGQPLKPLSKVVSGGELSRISLAIQVVTAQFSEIPTLIFDEVDVGIGGGIAEMVGNKLRLLGQNAQILCVTHQAQVASQAHHHLIVTKQSSTDHTSTQINKLDEEQRVDELSRMLGGIKITEKTRSHAREMLKQSEN